MVSIIAAPKVFTKANRHAGLADQLIAPNGTSDYYKRVMELDPNVSEYYRYFEAPGVEHCLGGPGAFPSGPLDALIKWVEDLTASVKRVFEQAGLSVSRSSIAPAIC